MLHIEDEIWEWNCRAKRKVQHNPKIQYHKLNSTTKFSTDKLQIEKRYSFKQLRIWIDQKWSLIYKIWNGYVK